MSLRFVIQRWLMCSSQDPQETGPGIQVNASIVDQADVEVVIGILRFDITLALGENTRRLEGGVP